MPVDTSGASVALGQLSNLPFGQLIGAPLKAAVEAQAIAADTTLNFIKEIGFTEDDTTNTLSATTVSFSFQGPSGETSILTVPVLCIVPIPYIEIETLDIAFKAKITASGSSSDTQTSSLAASGTLSTSAAYKGGSFKANLAISGSVSSKKDSASTRDSKYSVEYCYDLTLHAAQPGLPAGLSKILGILESSFTPVPAGQLRLSADSSSVTINNQGTQLVHIKVVSADGKPASGISVSSKSSNDSVVGVTPTSNSTDQDGVITFTLNAMATGAAQVSFTMTSGAAPLPAPQVVSATVT